MTGRCRTCRWWAPNYNGKQLPSSSYLVFACRNPLLNQQSFEIAEQPTAAGPDEGGHFLTGPDFGCMHHEAQP